LRHWPAPRRLDIGIATAAVAVAAVKALSQSPTVRGPPVARKGFRNLKCGARIQRGFTYCVTDNFKIICG
jgi:hypothetical protein